MVFHPVLRILAIALLLFSFQVDKIQYTDSMFTIEQIKTAHGKVKSGADFPNYIEEIKSLGVTQYVTYVADGHTDFFGTEKYSIRVPAKYEPKEIADTANLAEFKVGLLSHQHGKSDYPTFIEMCAETGVEKWEIRMDEMTCTYFDKSGIMILSESIPA